MHVLSSLAVVACTFEMGDISSPSSRQAEPASHSIADRVSSTIDLVCRVLVGLTFLVGALVAIERIRVDKNLLQGSACRLYDLDWIAFPSACSHLLLLRLHLFLQLGPWCWGDEDGRLPERSQPVVFLPPLGQPASRLVPALGAVHWSV